MIDNIARCITRWCYHRSSCGKFAQNTNGPCLLEKPFSPAAPAAVVIHRSAVISWWSLFREMQTGVDGLTSRIIIENSSVKAELKVYCFLSPLPPSFIFVCFHSSSSVFILLCVLMFTLSLLSSQYSIHPHCICSCLFSPSSSPSSSSTSSPSSLSLNLVELLFPPSLPSLSCRAPVTPSGVTRTVSDSRRTCYLVTRL